MGILSQTTLHQKQRDIWENEHKQPVMFPIVDSNVADPGVVRFWEYLSLTYDQHVGTGLEICCGKGRNTIWLAENGAAMTGFDFSTTAIETAKRLQEKLTSENKAEFLLHDALDPWPFKNEAFDFIVDSFGTADIESEKGRNHIINEAVRVLKKGGFYFMQIDSPELGFFAERMQSNPGPDKNTLVFPNGKIESVITENDISEWNTHHPLKIIEVRRNIEYNVEICGKKTPYKYFWLVMRLI